MNRKSLLPPGLYRIYATLPDPVWRLAGHGNLQAAYQLGAAAAVAAAARLADVADTLEAVKPGVVGVGVFNPTGSPRANLQGTGFAVLDGRYVVSCAHIFAKPLDSEKKETHAVFIGRDRQMAVRPAKLIATDRARDLALLKIEGDPLPALKLGDSDRAREGWQLYFTGYPIGSVLGAQSLHPPRRPRRHRADLHPGAAAWRS
jgi:serine protease Do